MIYVNQAASTYPKPKQVLEAHALALAAAPTGQFRSGTGRADPAAEECRRILAKLFGVGSRQRIFFTSGATMSANALLYGLKLTERHVITTVTEHNSILRPLFNLKTPMGEISLIPCDRCGAVSPTTIEQRIRADTVAIIVNHCSNVTGFVQDLAAIGKIARQHQVLFIVDAAQSAGCIPIRADEWQIDALIFTGHKSLFGPQGTGGYYIREGLALRPFVFGGTGLDSRRIRYESEPYEYEAGTQNLPGIKALTAGGDYILERGVARIQEGEQEKMERLYDGMAAIPGVTVYGAKDRNKGPLLSFNIAGLAPGDVAYILQNAYDIVVRAGLHCAPLIHPYIKSGEQGCVRISISDLNTVAEVAEVLRAIREIAKGAERSESSSD